MKSTLEQQAARNKAAIAAMSPAERAALVGFTAGEYVRIELHGVPYELVQYLNPRLPIILGGVQSGEDAVGFVNVRIKKHRWYAKILKSHDPLIISMGWRRFQTQPVYAIRDAGTRTRFLKYTPQHMHCLATFWGPLTPPNTGFVAFQRLTTNIPGLPPLQGARSFRVAATGVVLALDQSSEIVKKLKLVGYPYKILKNTAFIKDMFTSRLEVAKFIGKPLLTCFFRRFFNQSWIRLFPFNIIPMSLLSLALLHIIKLPHQVRRCARFRVCEVRSRRHSDLLRVPSARPLRTNFL